MASAARSLRLVCRSCKSARPNPTVHAGPRVFVAWKSVSSGGGAVKESAVKLDDGPKPTPYDHWEEEEKERDQKYRFMSPSLIAKDFMRNDSDDDAGRKALNAVNFPLADGEIAESQEDMRELVRPYIRGVIPQKESFWDEDEVDNELITNNDNDEFDENDMTDIAHAKLEEHREQRAYARIAIWEMPLLAKYAKPFTPPSAEQPLRFRYTSYMGEFHPAEKKVVVEFSPADFGLTELQQLKLKKLAGVRYNPEKEVIKMSCESFEHQAQNKRYLAETVEQLIAEARDPTDTFEDVPLDLRHHKFKAKPKFPKEWRMSEERMQEIVSYRKETKRLEQAKQAEGKLIDGLKVIEKAHASRTAAESVPLLVAASSRQRQRSGARY
ncbi:37S ribosomal protein S24, mitochondrial [Gnomoniopsis smithogilvyi]|uniref:37S ribosomal protein S24, mitochondrial n=1 Tax=Gnomoniopsis smithogilvyi TaxID=1191159 RepID=A0A9W8Z085_9PEZI|nr:37S ribosomal protein S24, mitochondrial [Gnomoniopsis smithogilvyi]